MSAGGYRMKKSLAVIVLIFVALVTPCIAEAAWDFVYEHQNGIQVYADPATCRTIDGGLEVRTRRVIPASIQASWSDREAYSEATYQFHSSAHTARLSNLQFYNNNGQFFKLGRDSEWEQYPPGSVIDNIYEYAVKTLGLGGKPSVAPPMAQQGAPVETPAVTRAEPPLQTGGTAGAARDLIGVYQHNAECPVEIYQAGDGTLYGAYLYESPFAGRYYGAGKDRTDITWKNFRKVGDNSWLADTYLYSTRYPSQVSVQADGITLDIFDLGSYFYKKVK